MTENTVSIVIPVYNCVDVIRGCLKACLNQEYPKEKLEIIVVDDGSVDNTKDIVGKYPVKYLYQERGGPAMARNNGWKNARGEIICFTDADCAPDRKWVSKLISSYVSDEIAGVGGTYGITNPGSLLASCIHQEIMLRHKNMPRFVNYLGSFNVSYRKTMLEEIGGFDESYKMACEEDNDLSYRIIKKNYKLIFLKEAKVNHRYPENILKYLKQQFYHGLWRMKIYRRHPDMAKGDVYSGLLDYIQPPIALLILALAPFALNFTLPRYLLYAMFLIYILIQILSPVLIVKNTANIKYLALAPITFLRGFWRGLGMFVGFFKFFIKR